MTDEPGDDYDQLVAAYREAFRLQDTAPLDVVVAVVMTASWPGDPLWTYVVGAPGSGKTELLDLFRKVPSVYPLSSLTPHSLISGLKDGQDLLPKLDQKTLSIKDLTLTLESDRFARDALFGALRDCFDGHCEMNFGTRGTVPYESHFNLVAGVTGAIENFYSVQSVLGQRFVLVRTSPPPDDFVADNARDIDAIRARLRDLVETLVRNRAALPDRPPISEQDVARIKGLAREVALLRTHVHRDGYTHEIASLPEPEAPTRLTNQFIKLARGSALAHAKSDVTEEELSLIVRVARDTVPMIRLVVLEAVHAGSPTIDQIASATGLSRRSVERKVEDLVALGVLVEDASSKPYLYSLARDVSFLPPRSKHDAHGVLDAAALERGKDHVRVRAAEDPARPPAFLARDAVLALQLPEAAAPELEAFAHGLRREASRA